MTSSKTGQRPRLDVTRSHLRVAHRLGHVLAQLDAQEAQHQVVDGRLDALLFPLHRGSILSDIRHVDPRRRDRRVRRGSPLDRQVRPFDQS